MRPIFRFLVITSFFLVITGCTAKIKHLKDDQPQPLPIKEPLEEEFSIIAAKQALKEGYHDKAKRILDYIARKEHENEIEICLLRGKLYRRQNRLQSARKELERCLCLLNPNVEQDIEINIYKSLAGVYYDLNDYAYTYLRPVFQ